MKSIAAAVLGIAIGMFAMWLAIDRGPEATPAAPTRPSADPDAVERLGEELAHARVVRVELEQQVAALEYLLAERTESDDARPPAVDGPGPDDPVDAPDPSAPKRDQGWFDRDALVAAGFEQTEIDWIRELFERALAARLELEDARLRKGEGNALHAIRDELALEQSLRAEFGDDDFDAVRFAMSEENRVILTDLLESSAGFQAGIRPGDEVISYDGQRIFRPRDLKMLIATGERDQPVEMRLLRDGEVVRVFVPRGPIGARLAFEVRPPIR